MKKKAKDNSFSGLKKNNDNKDNLPGYPDYPVSDDIYSKYQKEADINPEDPTKIKESTLNVKIGSLGHNGDLTGDNLDVPGSELDDEQEYIGSEDEENNYYSLGGEEHADLEEDKGE
jgi:hypothetical protein